MSTLIPLGSLRWLVRTVEAPHPTQIGGPTIGCKQKVLQQGFRKPDGDKIIWIDVPTVSDDAPESKG